MSSDCRHKRYFRVRGADSTLTTFTDVANANTLIGFKSAYSTSTPTKTEYLDDSDQTLVVTFEFNSQDEQTAFKAAVDAAWDGSTPFTGTGVEHFKTEWLNNVGEVGSTATF